MPQRQTSAALGATPRRASAPARRPKLVTTPTSAKGKRKGPKVTPKDVAVFTRQFGVMIGAGMPLVQALDVLAGQQENKGFGQALSEVRTSVESGSTLSNALKQHPRIFDTLYTNMVEAGETGGVLEGVLQRLSIYIEKVVKLRGAVKSALIYPVSVLVIAIGVIFLLLWKVVPIFTTLFVGLNAELPLPTRVVIELSHIVASFAWLGILAVGAGVFALRQYYRTPGGRLTIDRLILKLPVLGILMRKIGIARFTRTLGTLVASGVPILEAMDITARTAGNAVLENAIIQVRKAVEAGRTIVDPMRASGVFPNMVIQMIGVGEQTGALDSMLQKVSDFYEEEVDAAVAALLAAMEPMIILFLGTVVGGVVISMYLPLFSLIGKLAG